MTKEDDFKPYKKEDLKKPKDNVLDGVRSKINKISELRTELLEDMRKHKGLSVEEFEKIDTDTLHNDLVEYLEEQGINVTEDDIASFPSIKHPVESIFPTEAVNRDIFKRRNHGYTEVLKSTQNAYIYYGILFNDENVKINAELNQLDEIVHRGLITLHASSDKKENLAFSISTLYRTMVHNKDARLTDNYHKKIVESIQKMATTLVEIEVKKELEKTNYKLSMDKPTLTGNLINMTMLEGYQHGSKTTLIKLNQPPILYDYANKKNQIARLPNTLLDIPKINMSENNLILVDYLAAEIQYMKWKGRNKHINYDNLYNKLGLLDGTKQQKSRIRNIITKYIIPHWINEGWIVDAKQRMVNRKLNSLEIFL